MTRPFAIFCVIVVLCGCMGRDEFVKAKLYSLLDGVKYDLREGKPAFNPESLNKWVAALGTQQVVEQLDILAKECPDDREAVLWMLKAYAPAERFAAVAARYPSIDITRLPSVVGYGVHKQDAASKTNIVEGVYYGGGASTEIIELKNGRFRYWFESDVVGAGPPRSSYPFVGQYSVEGDVITLKHKDIDWPERIFRLANGKPSLWRARDWDEWQKTKVIKLEHWAAFLVNYPAEDIWSGAVHWRTLVPLTRP